MAVKREGGHRRITDNGMWAMIAKDIGYEYEDGEYMRLIYAMYLDVLVYYYKFKTTQEKALDKEEVQKVVDPRQSKSETNEVKMGEEDQFRDRSSMNAGAGNSDPQPDFRIRIMGRYGDPYTNGHFHLLQNCFAGTPSRICPTHHDPGTRFHKYGKS
ncbi:putative transcription factor & chromatin remodeling ARID family [Helianthus annuus]|nr:putative transcription factor & chromatin remodeling ARID family [Helianthus annuus]